MSIGCGSARGANGGVTRTILPGGIVVNLTAQSVRSHDGVLERGVAVLLESR